MLIAAIHLIATAAAAASAAAEPGRADLSAVPGIVIDHIPASTRSYVGSPGLAVLPGGSLAASHDIFGPGSPRDETRVFGSDDRGRTWRRLADIRGQWWSTLFAHRGGLYLLGTSREYGHAVIRRSADGGKTWTEPRDSRTGLLLADGKYHCAPVPVAVHGGRIWRAMEDAMGPGGWGHHFRAFVMSAPEDADLLDGGIWTSTNRIGRDPAWLDGAFGGWLEGNAVVTPDGKIVNILRVDVPMLPEKAAIAEVSADGKTLTFDAKAGFIDFPGGAKKFAIRRDPKAGLYWTLASPGSHEPGRKPGSVRNVLALASSPDLRSWTVRAEVLRHPDPGRHGFQYVEWLFDGDDMIAACRTAFDDGLGGAHNAHDANFLTFHRFVGFRGQ